MKINTIETFVKEWFAKFDALVDESQFLPYLSKDAKMVFPEGTVIGHDGFSQWYNTIKQTIKPNNTHTISNLKITSKTLNLYTIELDVYLKAELLDGTPFELSAHEIWSLEIINEHPIIHTYLVTLKN